MSLLDNFLGSLKQHKSVILHFYKLKIQHKVLRGRCSLRLQERIQSLVVPASGSCPLPELVASFLLPLSRWRWVQSPHSAWVWSLLDPPIMRTLLLHWALGIIKDNLPLLGQLISHLNSTFNLNSSLPCIQHIHKDQIWTSLGSQIFSLSAEF